MTPQTSTAKGKRSAVRAFLPFFVSLAVGAIMLAVEFHVRNAPRTFLAARVTLQGKQPEDPVWIEVDGRRHSMSSPISIGFARIQIDTTGAEPEFRSKFIWYGLNDLGTIDMKRSHGSLTASALPKPDRYELSGRLGSWTNTTGVFPNVPVGSYALVARFGAMSEQKTVEVTRNQENRVEVAARIGSLELSAEPPGEEFNLLADEMGENWSGKFPAAFPQLRAGGYRLFAKRQGDSRIWKLEVRPNETNRFVAKFTYGGATVTTTPAGATVRWAGSEKGTTPLTLTNLVPGEYKLEATLEGYDQISATVTVDENSVTNLVATLTNTAHRESMAAAREHLGRKQFLQAAKSLEAALAAQPEDKEAAQLLPETRARGLKDEAVALARRSEFGEALEALNAALKDAPGDPEIAAMQAKFRSQKSQFDKDKAASQFRRLMAEAKAAADQAEYDKALALLDGAKKIYPDNPEIPELVTLYRLSRARTAAGLDEKRR